MPATICPTFNTIAQRVQNIAYESVRERVRAPCGTPLGQAPGLHVLTLAQIAFRVVAARICRTVYLRLYAPEWSCDAFC